MLNRLDNSYWFVALVGLGLLLVLGLTLAQVGGGHPVSATAERNQNVETSQVPLDAAAKLFAKETLRTVLPPKHAVNPFFTKHFEPPPPAPKLKPKPKQKPKPKPKPPTTKKVSLVYQGYYETDDGTRLAFIQFDGKQFHGTVRDKVVADWTILEFDLHDLTLKDDKGANSVLPFDVKKELEVPLKTP